MDIFEAMFTRRSIRKYTQDPVDDEDLKLLLKAAMLAPSASNRQPWHFVVVRDANVRAAIAERHPIRQDGCGMRRCSLSFARI